MVFHCFVVHFPGVGLQCAIACWGVKLLLEVEGSGVYRIFVHTNVSTYGYVLLLICLRKSIKTNRNGACAQTHQIPFVATPQSVQAHRENKVSNL